MKLLGPLSQENRLLESGFGGSDLVEVILMMITVVADVFLASGFGSLDLVEVILMVITVVADLFLLPPKTTPPVSKN